ncbi:MAG TPA: ArdC-like ssDNA-binding domain-containing protein [Paludibacter sp.]
METQVNTQAKRKFYTKRQPTEAQREAMRAKREELKVLSKGIKILVKAGKYSSVNEGLIELYAENGHSNLKTIHQWNEINMSVKKGEHALLLWGTPKKSEKKQEATTPDQEEKELEFYPLCFVFSKQQIQPTAAK